MSNILEKAYSKNNKIRKIKNIMLESNAYYSSMSGAGPTVYGFFKNKKDARICLNKLKRSDKNIWVSIQ
jgi:4-diphosphocytidyl-2-C-methyl-D-erythritol kinase